MNKFNSRTHKLSAADDSTLPGLEDVIGPRIDSIKTIHNGSSMGIADSAINPGTVSQRVAGHIASLYIGAIDNDPSKVSDIAQELAGISLEPIREQGRATKNSTITINPRASRLVRSRSLNEFAQIPLEFTPEEDSGIPESLYTGISLKMDHFLRDPALPTHSKNGERFAAGHMNYPGFGETIVWPHIELAKMHDWVHDLLIRHISSGQCNEEHMQSLINGLGMLSEIAEPKEIIDKNGRSLGWEPWDSKSEDHLLKYPVPLHHAVEQVLGNVHASPGVRLRKTGDDGRDKYYQQLYNSIPGVRLGLDLSPMTLNAASQTSRSLLYDQQYKMRVMDSSRDDHDPLLAHIVKGVLLRKKSITGLDLSPLAPRTGIAAGNLDWDTGGAQLIMKTLEIAQQRRTQDGTYPDGLVLNGMEKATPEFLARVNLLSRLDPGQDYSGIQANIDELRKQYRGNYGSRE